MYLVNSYNFVILSFITYLFFAFISFTFLIDRPKAYRSLLLA